MTDAEEQKVKEALSFYHLRQPQVHFLRHNENLTCRIIDGRHQYVLRIRSRVEGFWLTIFGSLEETELMQSEVELLRHLSRSEQFLVQTPIKTIQGNWVAILSDGSPVCLLNWIDGEVLTEQSISSNIQQLGVMTAQLHEAVKGYSGYRLSYDEKLVRRMQKEVQGSNLATLLGEKLQQIYLRVLNRIADVIEHLRMKENACSYIHADLGCSNILITSSGTVAIDYSLSGYGFREMELGMLATNLHDEKMIQILCRAYEEQSGYSVDRNAVEVFFAMAVMMFICCQYTRYGKDDWFRQSLIRWGNTCFQKII